VRITVKVGPGATSEDFRNVVRHEIGHALGLGHSNDPNDLMYPTYDASKTNVDVHPSTLDLDALLSIYYQDGFGLPNLPPEQIPSSYTE
jgi:predicted Zn-dependent protease